jgi:hypothetical protein
MKLEKEDVDLFYKLHSHLLAFANQRLKILKEIDSADAMISVAPEEKIKLRDALYKNRELIDEFVKSNPDKFNKEELSIISSWEDLLEGKFYIFRYLKKYTVLLSSGSPNKAYGVLALRTDFDEMIGPYLPVLIETVLLPFKGQIIYDGLLSGYPITFGGGARRSFAEAYEEAKASYGIITSLPFRESSAEQSDEDKLKFYLKNESNRELYQQEIWALTRKNKNLLILYHQERGKFHARSYGKRLRELGFSNVWFAILSGMIIASEKTKDGLEVQLDNIVPEDQRELVYIFHLKK